MNQHHRPARAVVFVIKLNIPRVLLTYRDIWYSSAPFRRGVWTPQLLDLRQVATGEKFDYIHTVDFWSKRFRLVLSTQPDF